MNDSSKVAEKKQFTVKTSFFNYRNRMSKFVIDLVDSNNPIHVLNDKYMEYEAYRLDISIVDIQKNNDVGLITSYTDDLRELAESMANIYKEMLVTVFEGESLSKDLEKKIESSLIKPTISWHAKGMTGNRLDGKFIKIESNSKKYTLIKLNLDSAKRLFTLATKDFLDAFDTFTYKTPSGYNYFGKCERCGQYFSKIRSSQKFCGTRCKNATGQAVFRSHNMKKE